MILDELIGPENSQEKHRSPSDGKVEDDEESGISIVSLVLVPFEPEVECDDHDNSLHRVDIGPREVHDRNPTSIVEYQLRKS